MSRKEDQFRVKIEWIVEEEQQKSFQLIKDRIEIAIGNKEKTKDKKNAQSIASFKKRVSRMNFVGPGHNSK